MRYLMRAVLLAISMFAGAVWAAPTGYVHAISGDVTIARAGQAPVKAKLGDLFEQGTAFATGLDGTVTLRFADGQVLALSSRTQFVVTTYVYNTASTANSNILFSLARGGMRFVTGLIGHTAPTNFAIRTPTLTAGVRGTDGTIVTNDSGTVVSVKDGVVTIKNANGTVVLDVAAGTYAFYGPNKVPGTDPPTSSGAVANQNSAIGALEQDAANLGNVNMPPPTPGDVVVEAQQVIAEAAGGPGGNPAPANGPAGGGGGGVGVSPH